MAYSTRVTRKKKVRYLCRGFDVSRIGVLCRAILFTKRLPNLDPMSNPKNPEPAVGQVWAFLKTGEVFGITRIEAYNNGQVLWCYTGKRVGLAFPDHFEDATYLGTLDELRAWAEQRQALEAENERLRAMLKSLASIALDISKRDTTKVFERMWALADLAQRELANPHP